ncbi:hypothetical protein HY029_04970 [Candidatus Gottesmanbacteria bacterium]|nr:hypothetical protein [Candidatus Gottesmanbacteria bacterium]
MTNLSNKLVLSVFIAVLIVYLGFAGRFKFYFPKTSRDFFTSLSYSFLHGKLDIPNPRYSPNDLSFYDGKNYLYWGPLPAILLLPASFLWGKNLSDIFYTVIFGTLNVLLMYILFYEFKLFEKLKISTGNLILMTFCFAFGTIHFYLSILGTVWFSSQIISLTVYILSLLFLFKYLNNEKYFYAILSIFFLGLSILGKYTFLLSVPLHFEFLCKKSRMPNEKKIKLILILLLFIVMIAIYNYLRFNSIFENGLRFMQINPKFYLDIKNLGYFNLYYLFRNLYYLLFNLNLPDPTGNSIFITSPIMLLILHGIYKKYFKKKNFIFQLLLTTSVLILLPALLYYGGGWYQWGFRYALDIYPLLFLLLLLIVNKYNKYIVFSLSIISIIINLYGTLWMLDFAKYAYF